ncbi:hypothetical protein [Streptomyces luteireticuli]|uniref:hypothetical protein n=1 Tax=Streptomyces luteireticuli TaxID=173858 RepID=UPI003556D181
MTDRSGSMRRRLAGGLVAGLALTGALVAKSSPSQLSVRHRDAARRFHQSAPEDDVSPALVLAAM